MNRRELLIGGLAFVAGAATGSTAIFLGEQEERKELSKKIKDLNVNNLYLDSLVELYNFANPVSHIYTNDPEGTINETIATFLFEGRGHVGFMVGSYFLFSDPDIGGIFDKLEDGKWTPEERAHVRKLNGSSSGVRPVYFSVDNTLGLVDTEFHPVTPSKANRDNYLQNDSQVRLIAPNNKIPRDTFIYLDSNVVGSIQMGTGRDAALGFEISPGLDSFGGSITTDSKFGINGITTRINNRVVGIGLRDILPFLSDAAIIERNYLVKEGYIGNQKK